jgi:hypothetical protein
MTDDEYKKLLSALARKHLQPNAPIAGDLQRNIEELSRAARLNQVVADDPESTELSHALARRLREAPVQRTVHLMEQAGIVAALDDVPEVVFRNLRRSAIPNEDIEILRDAGFRYPEEELTIAVYAAQHLRFAETPRPGEIFRQMPGAIGHAANRIENSDPPKKRKICNGIGNVLGGLIGGAGNTLLALGTLAAPNPATAYLAIGSAAAAVPLILKGIGDLRGE